MIVCNNNDALFELFKLLNNVNDFAFQFRIEGVGGFVENQNGRRMNEATDQIRNLALPTGQFFAQVATGSLVDIDIFVQLFDFRVGHNLRQARLTNVGIRAAKHQILDHGAIKQFRVLVNVRDFTAQKVIVNRVNVESVDVDGPLIALVQLDQEFHKGALALAGESGDANDAVSVGLQRHVDIFKDQTFSAVVAVGDVAKVNLFHREVGSRLVNRKDRLVVVGHVLEMVDNVLAVSDKVHNVKHFQ